MTGKDRVLVKIIKETPDKICKVGQQIEVSEEGANELIKHGYAQPLTQNKNALVTNREHTQTMTDYAFNEADARAFYKWLRHRKGEYTEIRAIEWIDPEIGKGNATTYFVTNEDDFITVCKQLNGQTQVYAGINPRCRKPKKGGSTEDIKRVTGFPFDIDGPTANHKKQASNTLEITLAEQWKNDLVKEIKQQFEIEPYIDFSGNGYRVCLPVEIDVTTHPDIANKNNLFFNEYKEKLKLPSGFDNISDLPRIIKVPGVWSIKGKNTPERPHRQAKLIQLGDISAEAITKVSEYIKNLEIKQKTAKTIEAKTITDLSPIKLIKIRPCFQDFIQNPTRNRVCFDTAKDDRNTETGLRKALVKELHHANFTKAEILSICTKFDDYEENKSNKEIETVIAAISKDKDKNKPFTCKSIFKNGGCLGEKCTSYRNKILGEKKQPQQTTEKNEQIKNEQNLPPANLEELKETYQKWLYLDGDHEVIDVIYSCFIDRKLPGDPLWMALISPSGGTKTEIVKANQTKHAYTLDSLTAHTLISGKIERDEEGNAYPVEGILTEIDNKVLIIKDFTIILAKRQEERDEIFSQFRGLYDGCLEFAYGTVKEPIRVKAQIGLVIAVTPAIDQYSKLYVQLGERFLKIRHQPNSAKATDKAMQNLGKEEQMRQELTTIAQRFLNSLKDFNINPVSEKHFIEIKKLAQATAILRTPVSINFWKYEINSTLTPSIEYPTRLSKQLLKLANALTVVRGKKTPTNDEIETVRRVARDTVYPYRIKILAAIKDGKPYITREISAKTGIPLSTCWRELKEMEYLGVLKYEKVEEEINQYRPLKHIPEKDGWTLTKKSLKILLQKRLKKTKKESKTKNKTKTTPKNIISVSPNPIRTYNENIYDGSKPESARDQNPLGLCETSKKLKNSLKDVNPENNGINQKQPDSTKSDEKPTFYVKEIKPGEKCDGCGKLCVNREVLTPSKETLRRCENCVKDLERKFSAAEFKLACADLPDYEEGL